LTFNFSQCSSGFHFSDDNSFILESKSAADFARTKSTKVIDSAKRRKLARSVKVGDFLAVENPDKANACKFWLAKVQKPAAQHHGAQKKVNRVTFVKKGYYNLKFMCTSPNWLLANLILAGIGAPMERAPAPGW
jgi:hypothetical protein